MAHRILDQKLFTCLLTSFDLFKILNIINPMAKQHELFLEWIRKRAC